MSRKLLYLVITLALVLGLAPAAVFASSPANLSPSPSQTVEWNVLGAEQTFNTPDGSDAMGPWTFIMKDGLTDYALVAGGMSGDNYATVTAEGVGALSVSVTTESGTYLGEKKWGEIESTRMLSWVDLDHDGQVDRGNEYIDYDMDGKYTPGIDGLIDLDNDGIIELVDELQPVGGSSQMVWDEYDKTYNAWGQVWDEVTGAFMMNYGSPGQGLATHLADGAIVHWFLFDASVDIRHVNRLDDEAALLSELEGMLYMGYGAQHVKFEDDLQSGQATAHPYLDGTYAQTTSGDWSYYGYNQPGLTSIGLKADAEESVRIVALVSYGSPQGVQHMVRPEFFSWNFWTQENEKVPQVRWAGEKIVLEKYWGVEFAEDPEYAYFVHYALEGNSPGTLESVDIPLGNLTNDATSVWTPIDPDGVSECILTSEKPGECDVTAGLYAFPLYEGDYGALDGQLINQHGFVVFFLKLESITLTKVPGERALHNDGLWMPANPVIEDPTPAGQLAADVTAKEANVSADELLRVRVQGWFMGDDMSIREKSYCDVNGNGMLDMYDYVLPEGRWVLPDDWQYLAGPEWNEFRPHWDIMNDPGQTFLSTFNPWWQEDVQTPEIGPLEPGYVETCPVGPYGFITGYDIYGMPIYMTVAGASPIEMLQDLWHPVIGPYSSLDDYLPGCIPDMSNEIVPRTSLDYGLIRDTVVPNGQLNWWDCPMPPAKVTFEIVSGPGYFKAADKDDIYYVLTDAHNIWPSVTAGAWSVIQYTNPFYVEEIAASPEIPAVVNNGGYDWDSWGFAGDIMGPYPFWDIINSLPNANAPSDGIHPTKVQVYSDNHGEAMVYLNGDWNLELPIAQKGYSDIQYNSVVGETTVIAKADYPYMRKHPVIVSNPVTDTWLWGKDIVILVEQSKDAQNNPDPTNKRVWVLVSDRDEFPAIGETIVWQILPGQPGMLYDGAAGFTYGYLDPSNPLAGWQDPGDKTIATTKTYFDIGDMMYLANLFGVAVPMHAFGISYVDVNAEEGSTIALKLLLDESMRANGEPGEGVIERMARSAGQQTAVLDFSQNGQPGQDPTDPIEYLAAGWNLVSFKSSNQSIADAVESIQANLVSVWAFDNQTKNWKAYSPTAPGWANDLKSMDTATPYWIEVNSDLAWAY